MVLSATFQVLSAYIFRTTRDNFGRVGGTGTGSFSFPLAVNEVKHAEGEKLKPTGFSGPTGRLTSPHWSTI